MFRRSAERLWPTLLVLIAVGGCAHLGGKKEQPCPVPPIEGPVTCDCGPEEMGYCVPDLTPPEGGRQPLPLSLLECVHLTLRQRDELRQLFDLYQPPASEPLPMPPGAVSPLVLVLVPKVTLEHPEYVVVEQQLEDLMQEVMRRYWRLRLAETESAAYRELLEVTQGKWAQLQQAEAAELLTVQQRAAWEMQLEQLREAVHVAEQGGAGQEGVAGAELALREVMGLPPVDDYRLTATDEPTIEPLATTWEDDARFALWQRLDLRQARGEVYDARWQFEQPPKRRAKPHRQSPTKDEVVCEGKKLHFQKSLALRALERKTIFELLRARRQTQAAEQLSKTREARRDAVLRLATARDEELERGRITWDAWLKSRRETIEAQAAVEAAAVEHRLAVAAYLRAKGGLLAHFGVELLASADRSHPRTLQDHSTSPQETAERARLNACIERTIEEMQIDLQTPVAGEFDSAPQISEDVAPGWKTPRKGPTPAPHGDEFETPPIQQEHAPSEKSPEPLPPTITPPVQCEPVKDASAKGSRDTAGDRRASDNVDWLFENFPS